MTSFQHSVLSRTWANVPGVQGLTDFIFQSVVTCEVQLLRDLRELLFC